MRMENNNVDEQYCIIDPNQSRDFHPAVLLIWWAR